MFDWIKLETNLLDDPRIQALMKDYGMGGFGIYVLLRSQIGAQAGHGLPLENILKRVSAYARKNRTTSVLYDYDLFAEDEFGIIRACTLTPAHGTPAHGTPTHGTPTHGTPGHGTPGHEPTEVKETIRDKKITDKSVTKKVFQNRQISTPQGPLAPCPPTISQTLSHQQTDATMPMIRKNSIAFQYFPSAKSKKSATTNLARAINRCKQLREALANTKGGYQVSAKYFTPQQVRLIYDYLGEPDSACL